MPANPRFQGDERIRTAVSVKPADSRDFVDGAWSSKAYGAHWGRSAESTRLTFWALLAAFVVSFAVWAVVCVLVLWAPLVLAVVSVVAAFALAVGRWGL